MGKTYQGIGLKCASHMVTKTHKIKNPYQSRYPDLENFFLSVVWILIFLEKLGRDIDPILFAS